MPGTTTKVSRCGLYDNFQGPGFNAGHDFSQATSYSRHRVGRNNPDLQFMLRQLLEYIQANPLEATSFAPQLLGVYLNARENVWGWPTGIAGVALAIGVYVSNRLYAEAGLYVFFVITGFYGWWQWLRKRDTVQLLQISRLKGMEPLYTFLAGLVGMTVLGFFLDAFTDTDVPFLDAAVTAYSLVAQLLMARKKVENWALWIAIDVLCVGIYAYKGLYMFMLLYFVFLFLAIMGLREWEKKASKLPS